MKEEFREGYDSPHKDPLDGEIGHSATGFDWDDLFRRLGEGDCPLDERDYVAMGQALRRIFGWILEWPANSNRGLTITRIGRRTLALIWTVSPDLLNCSLRRLAARAGCLRQSLQIHSADVRATFRVQNRYQSHAWNYGRKKTGDAKGKRGRVKGGK
jgi:hypothetical protein